MKEQILQLRAEGKIYKEIMAIVGCSCSTVSYYCGEGMKTKTLERNQRNRKKEKGVIKGKIERFFQRYTKERQDAETVALAIDKVKNSQFCYLSGRPINLSDGKSYHLDHIIPYSKGGENSVINLGVTTKEVNMAKSDISLEDFLKLCVDICKYNGYNVVKK